ncbi:MAG: VPLPA-CTERM sorting domain-containing protein [Pseudomonadota bacterium]
MFDWVKVNNMTTADLMKTARGLSLASAIAVAGVGAASAATLEDVVLGGKIYDNTALDVLADDDTFLASDFFDVFVSLDFDGLTSIESSNANDLDVTDATGSLLGPALDFAFDFAGNTLSILYGLDTNTIGDEPFGVAVLSFFGATGGPVDLVESGFAFSDLDATFADVEVFGATGPSVIPLPASLPLLIAGLGGIAILRRRRA